MKWLSAVQKWFLAQSIAVKALSVVLCVALVGTVAFAGYVGLKPDSDPEDKLLTASNDDNVVMQELKDELSEQQADEPEPQEDQQEDQSLQEDEELGGVPFVNTSGKLINGNFANGIEGFEVFSFVPENISYTADAKNGFAIDIADTGDEDWHIQLKQGGIMLEKGSWYKLSLDARSSVDRDILCAMQRDGSLDDIWTAYSPSQAFALTKNWQTFVIYFQMSENTDKNSVFNLSMGTVNGDRITRNHTVGIRNISLQKLDSSWLASLRQGDNLIGNADFTYKDILWETTIVAPGAAKTSFGNGKAVFDISNPGELDWNVQLKQSGIVLENGKGYRLTFKASSTVARTIKIGFMDKDFVNWYGGADVMLGSGEEQTVTVEFYMDKATNTDAVMMVSMGKIENQNTPASVITLSDFKLVKAEGITVASNTGGGGGGGGNSANPITDLTDGWLVYDHEDQHAGSCYVDGGNGYKIDIYDTGTEDWHVQLQKKNVTLEKDKWYKITMEAKSSLNRNIMYMIQRDGSADEIWTTYSTGDSGKVSLTGEWQTITQTFKMNSATDKNAIFNVSLGTIDGVRITKAHSVWIRNIKLEEVEEPKQDNIPVNQEMLQNVNFADEGSKWEKYVDNGAAASVKFEENKAVFNISNVGQNDYDIQLKQGGLLLEKGCKYRVTFEAESTATRTIKVGLLGPAPDYKWYGGKDVQLVGTASGLVARNSEISDMMDGIMLLSDSAKLITLEFTMSQDTDPNATLQISMGQIWEQDENGQSTSQKIDTPPSVITLSNFSMMKIAEAEATPDPNEPDEPDEPSTAPPTTSLTDGWAVNDFEGAHTVKSSVDGDNGYKIEIKDTGTEEWHIQLQKTGIKLEAGKKYTVTLEAKSTLSRSIIYMLQENGGEYKTYSDWAEGNITLTDSWQTFSQTFTMNGSTDENVVFNFSLGTAKDARITDRHTVWIRNIKLEDVTETNPNPDTGDQNLLKNGNFADGKANWQSNIYDNNEDVGDDKKVDASSSFEGGKATFTIKRIGVNDKGGVQLQQSGLTLEAGQSYKVSFHIKSNKSRVVKFAFIDPDNGWAWYGGENFSLDENEDMLIERTVTVGTDKSTSSTIAFQISMGMFEGVTDPGEHIIEISNVSVIKQ